MGTGTEDGSGSPSSATSVLGVRRKGEVTPEHELPVLTLAQAQTMLGRAHDVNDDEVPGHMILDGFNIRTLGHTIEIDCGLFADLDEAIDQAWSHLNYRTRKELIEARNRLKVRLGLAPVGLSA